MTAFLSCISPDLSRETLIWVSLVIQPCTVSRWQWKRLPCSPLLCVSHSLALEPSRKPSWVWLLPGWGAFSVLTISASRPRRKHVNICVFTGVHLRGAPSNLVKFRTSFAEVASIMLRTSVLLWVPSRLAWERQAGEARQGALWQN